MAGHARYTAVLDACVLYSICVCDALMSVAATGIYAAQWTRRIDDEWTCNLHPDVVLAAQIDRGPLRVLPAFKKMRARLRNPDMTPAEFADVIERNGLPQTASILRVAAELI